MSSYCGGNLKERIYHSTKCSQSHFIPFYSSARPSYYKQYDSRKISVAVDAVVKGMSIRRAAEEYSLPKSTLHDYTSGRTEMGSTSGPPRYLSETEEEELVCFVLGCASVGYARSKSQIISMVQDVMQVKLGDQARGSVKVTSGWFASFCKRHPQLTVRCTEKLPHYRFAATSTAVLDTYFDLLEQTLDQNDLLNSPSRIFNCDESGIPLDPTPPKVIVSKGTKHPRCVTTGDKAQITVLACCNAAGQVLPPFVIFDRKTLKAEMAVGEVPETMYGLSDNGWIDSDLFEQWFKHHFLAYAPPIRPILLLLDGHSTHYQPGVIRMAAKEQVILFCLPPHSSHLTQPLDKGCFSPLKRYWREECKKYLVDHPGRVMTRFQFSRIFSAAWFKGMTSQNVIAGFKTTGVFPLDRLVVQDPDASSTFNPATLAVKSGIKFVPLYSPSASRLKSCTSLLSQQKNESDATVRSWSSFANTPVEPTSIKCNEDEYEPLCIVDEEGEMEMLTNLLSSESSASKDHDKTYRQLQKNLFYREWYAKLYQKLKGLMFLQKQLQGC